MARRRSRPKQSTPLTWKGTIIFPLISLFASGIAYQLIQQPDTRWKTIYIAVIAAAIVFFAICAYRFAMWHKALSQLIAYPKVNSWRDVEKYKEKLSSPRTDDKKTQLHLAAGLFSTSLVAIAGTGVLAWAFWGFFWS